MTMTKKEISSLVTSDKLHNKNCFNYLRNLKMPDFLLKNLPNEFAALAEIKNGAGIYDPAYPYGDLYKRFFDYIDNKAMINELYDKKLPEYKESIESQLELAEAKLEQQKALQNESFGNLQGFMKSFREKLLPAEIEHLKKERDTMEEQLDDLFISIYANDNKVLEETYKVIKDITLAQTPISAAMKSSIAKHTKEKGELINKKSLTPSQTESTLARVTSVLSDNYKPQHTTSLATERHYKWNEKHAVKEYRFGTQGQRQEGVEQASPLFEQFLKIQDKRAEKHKENPQELQITHIYFNNLGRDRTDFEGKKEQRLTQALEKLEAEHPNVAVITLPADKGLMDHHDYMKATPAYSYDNVREDFLKLASQDPTCTQPIKDFYISQRIRETLFKGEDGEYSIEAEKAKLGELIDKSFTALGIEKGTILSPAQRQAILFHFIKYELTNHIVSTLKSKAPGEELSINFSCKDAIDRGGVSSAYYNLMNSFNSPFPMNREEFERGLHAAPTMVKGRGMNDHIKIIWNAVNSYVNNNYETLKGDSDKSWLIEWRDLNCPKACVQEVLKHRIPQLQDELKMALKDPGNQSEAINKGLTVLDKISEQIDKGVSGKRLLLEAAVQTPAIALNPTKDNINRYEKLSDKLEIKSPALNIIGGLMKAFVGLVVYAISGGKNSEVLKQGIATTKAGIDSVTRKELQFNMKEQLQKIRSSQEQIKQEVPSPSLPNHTVF